MILLFCQFTPAKWPVQHGSIWLRWEQRICIYPWPAWNLTVKMSPVLTHRLPPNQWSLNVSRTWQPRNFRQIIWSSAILFLGAYFMSLVCFLTFKKNCCVLRRHLSGILVLMVLRQSLDKCSWPWNRCKRSREQVADSCGAHSLTVSSEDREESQF